MSDTTGCCGAKACQSYGCNGGQVGTPWSWFKSIGVVTGGDYGDNKLCYDYTMPKCAHHVTVEGIAQCNDVMQIEPTCNTFCKSNQNIDYEQDKKLS